MVSNIVPKKGEKNGRGVSKVDREIRTERMQERTLPIALWVRQLLE